MIPRSSSSLGAGGLLFFALVEMAFSLLMRLPQRLEAERESERRRARGLPRRPAEVLRAGAAHARAMLIVAMVVLLAQTVDPRLGRRARPARQRRSASRSASAQVAAGAHRAARPGAVSRAAAAGVHRRSPTVVAPLTALVIGWLGPVPTARPRGRRTARRAERDDAGRTERRRGRPTRAGCCDRSSTSARRSCARS